MNRNEKFLFAVFVIIVQLLQFLGVYFIAWMNNHVIEFMVIFLSFQLNRNAFGKSYHANELSKCTLYTLVIFYFLIKGIVPFDISLFITPLFGVYLSYLLNKIQELIDNQEVPKVFIHKDSRDIIREYLKGDMSKEHILDICIKNGMNKNIAETIYLYLDNSKTEVADMLDIDPSTVSRRIKKFITKVTLK